MEKNQPTQEKRDNDYEKLSLKEFLSISVWVSKLLFKMFPVQAIIYTIGEVLRNLQDLLSAYLFALLVDDLIKLAATPERDLTKIYPVVIALLAFQTGQTVINFLYRNAWFTIRVKGPVLLRQAYYKKLGELGIQTLEQPEVNNKIFRGDGYLGNLFFYFSSEVMLVAYLIKMVTAMVVVSAMAPYFVIVLCIVYIPIFFFDKHMRTKIYKFDLDSTEDTRVAGETAAVLTSTRTLPEVFITQAFKFLDDKYQKISLAVVGRRLYLSQIQRLVGNGYDLIINCSIIVVGLDIMKKALSGVISIGQVTFWMRSLFSLNDSIDTTLSYFNDLTETSLRYKDLYSIFTMESAVKDGSLVLPRMYKGPSVEFSNMSFKYPSSNKLVLKKLDLKIESEQKIAIVGYNGAGKTTLVKLISRFYQPSEGKILVNGTDLSEIKIESLYKNMGVLFQEFNTYPQLTVKENIFLGKSTDPLSEQKIIEAAGSADSMAFINEYKNKFDQLLSERYKGGIRPSTGQWQKLAIARFFYRNAPLVIFDEPTASIDAVSEYNIFNRIYEFFKGKTVIIISHRFSTVRNADRILVLDKGSIIEDGSHDELMRLDGFYARSFRLQAEGYRETTSSLVSTAIDI
jgi:ABC-type multidrug transport system fused ATPase/permease subunit